MTGARDEETATRLRYAPLELVGRFAHASNATLLVRLLDRDPREPADIADHLGREPGPGDLDPDGLAVYKPAEGESPLWDFPDRTLHRREIAAYELSVALAWDLVPVTVERQDAPLGPGSLQRYVPHDPREHYFTLLESGDEDVRCRLRAMVVFDLVANNADRKAGHVLREQGPRGRGRVRLIDHGVTFHVQPKLRTVAWDFTGEPVPEGLRADVGRLSRRLRGELGERLACWLSPEEVVALRERADATARLAALPEPRGPHPYPWPLL